MASRQNVVALKRPPAGRMIAAPAANGASMPACVQQHMRRNTHPTAAQTMSFVSKTVFFLLQSLERHSTWHDGRGLKCSDKPHMRAGKNATCRMVRGTRVQSICPSARRCWKDRHRECRLTRHEAVHMEQRHHQQRAVIRLQLVCVDDVYEAARRKQQTLS